MYLEVTPKGNKRWRLKYRFAGREKRISFGGYPDVSLKDARTRRDEARRLLANDVDPSVHRKQAQRRQASSVANTFQAIAVEWFVKHEPNWAKGHSTKIIQRLERDIFPWVGCEPIGEISAQHLLQTIRRIKDRGALETAHRALANCGQVFRYAVATGLADRDISTDLRGALPPVKTKHFPAVTKPDEAGELLRTLSGYQGSLIVACAPKLAPLVFVRPGDRLV